jgi:hypothetical protein
MKANNYKRQMKGINEIYDTEIIKAFTLLYVYRRRQRTDYFL